MKKEVNRQQLKALKTRDSHQPGTFRKFSRINTKPISLLKTEIILQYIGLHPTRKKLSTMECHKNLENYEFWYQR